MSQNPNSNTNKAEQDRCPHCRRMCESQAVLAAHIEREHPNKAEPCPYCENVTVEAPSMAMHLQLNHLNEPGCKELIQKYVEYLPEPCPTCGCPPGALIGNMCNDPWHGTGFTPPADTPAAKAKHYYDASKAHPTCMNCGYSLEFRNEPCPNPQPEPTAESAELEQATAILWEVMGEVQRIHQNSGPDERGEKYGKLHADALIRTQALIAIAKAEGAIEELVKLRIDSEVTYKGVQYIEARLAELKGATDEA